MGLLLRLGVVRHVVSEGADNLHLQLLHLLGVLEAMSLCGERIVLLYLAMSCFRSTCLLREKKKKNGAFIEEKKLTVLMLTIEYNKK